MFVLVGVGVQVEFLHLGVVESFFVHITDEAVDFDDGRGGAEVVFVKFEEGVGVEVYDLAAGQAVSSAVCDVARGRDGTRRGGAVPDMTSNSIVRCLMFWKVI